MNKWKFVVTLGNEITHDEFYLFSKKRLERIVKEVNCRWNNGFRRFTYIISKTAGDVDPLFQSILNELFKIRDRENLFWSYLDFICLSCGVPWIPEVFLACGGNFRCWPKTDTSSAVGRGNRASEVSGTQGTCTATWQLVHSWWQ